MDQEKVLVDKLKFRLEGEGRLALECLDGALSNNDLYERFDALCMYRQHMRVLKDKFNILEQKKKGLANEEAKQQEALWALNQRHNALLSEIEHLKRRQFEFITKLGDEGAHVVGLFLSDPNDGAIASELEKERKGRVDIAYKYKEKQRELEVKRKELEQVREQRVNLDLLVKNFVQSEPAMALKRELEKNFDDKYMQLDTDEQVVKSIREIYEALSTEQEPIWMQLRFFDLDDEEEEQIQDPLYSHGPKPMLRCLLSEDVKVSVYRSDRLVFKMDPIEFKLDDPDQWLVGLTTLGNQNGNDDVLQTLKRIKQTWLSEEGLKQAGFPEFKVVGAHIFSFELSDEKNKAHVRVKTVPNPEYAIETLETDDEVFGKRCRLIQERLNGPEMSASNISDQIAYLRRLVLL